MPLSGKVLVKLLLQNGWQLQRVNGSHHILVKGCEVVSVPVHGNRDLSRGTEAAILKKAGLKK